MRVAGGESWRIQTSQGRDDLDLALWVRAAERIEVAGPLVPGPLDIDPLPPPSPTDVEGDGAGRRADELAEGWAAWWETEMLQPPEAPAGPPSVRRLVRELRGSGYRRHDLSFHPPDFDGLRRWPYLHEVVSRRWLEAQRWHRDRQPAATDRMLRSAHAGRVPIEVERWLGRPVPPFRLELIILPVLDDEVRRVWDGRYLVPERVYHGPGWLDILQRLVMRLS